MNEEIKEALIFFNLEPNFTWEDLQRVYKPLVRDYHPDQNGIEKQEDMKLINAHFSVLRKYEQDHRQENLTKLKDRIHGFTLVLKADKNKYNLDFMTEIINRYIVLLNGVRGFIDLKNLKKDYLEESSKAFKEYKEKQEFNLRQRKNSVRQFYGEKLKSFLAKSLENPGDYLKAIDNTRTIVLLINNCSLDDFDELIKKLNDIAYKDVISDSMVLERIKTNYEIYLNIYTASIVLVFKMDDERTYYAKEIGDIPASVETRKFKHDFVSLKKFVDDSYYVGDRDVLLVNRRKEIVRRDLPLSRYIYFNYDNGLMLIYKEDDKDQKFTFYAEEKWLSASGARFKIGEEREDTASGKYKDKALLYKEVVEDINRNLLKKNEQKSARKK